MHKAFMLMLVTLLCGGVPVHGKNSKQILKEQVASARKEGFSKITDEGHLFNLALRGDVVRVGEGVGFYMDPRVGMPTEKEENWHPTPWLLHYTWPHNILFFECVGPHFDEAFPERDNRFKVGSVLRTPWWQSKLQNQRGKENAANPACSGNGSVCSPHLFDAVDISKRLEEAQLPWDERRWIRNELRRLEKLGLVVGLIDERSNNAFHFRVQSSFACEAAYPKPSPLPRFVIVP